MCILNLFNCIPKLHTGKSNYNQTWQKTNLTSPMFFILLIVTKTRDETGQEERRRGGEEERRREEERNLSHSTITSQLWFIIHVKTLLISSFGQTLSPVSPLLWIFLCPNKDETILLGPSALSKKPNNDTSPPPPPPTVKTVGQWPHWADHSDVKGESVLFDLQLYMFTYRINYVMMVSTGRTRILLGPTAAPSLDHYCSDSFLESGRKWGRVINLYIWSMLYRKMPFLTRHDVILWILWDFFMSQ